MQFEEIDNVYEEKKREATSKYNLLVIIVNNIKDPKKKKKEQDKADDWYKKKLKKIKMQYGRSIRYKIETSAFITKIKNTRLVFEKILNDTIHYFEKNLSILAPILNFFLMILRLIGKIIFMILYILSYPFIKIFGKPTTMVMVTVIFPLWYKTIDSIKFQISKVKDLVRKNKPVRAIDAFVSSVGTKRSTFEIKRELETIIKTPITEIASKSVVTIKSTETIEAALSKMKYERVGTLVVVDSGTIVGLLSEKDLMKIEVRLDMLKTKVEEVMEKNVSKVDSKAKVIEVMENMISYDVRKVIVGIKSPFMIVSTRDILHLLDNITKRFHIQTVYLKRIHEIMNKNVVTITKTEKATYARITMSRNKVGFLIVVDEKTKEPVGIISKKDYLMELLLGVERIRKLNVENIMKTHMSHIKPHLNILEANSEMLRKSFRKEVVKDKDKVIGVIGQYEIFREIYYFIKLTLKQIEKGQTK